MTGKRRNRKHEPGAGAFQNSPFAALKGAIRTSSPVPPKAAPAAESSGEPEDEEDLFLRSVNGAKRMSAESEPEPEQRPVPMAAGTRADDDAGDREQFLRALGAIGTTGFQEAPQEHEEDAPVRSTSGRMRQLKRGTIRIGAELDLHGYLKDEAVRRLEQFIAGAAERGHQAVLVITGKGTNSPEGPVLPGVVGAWLRDKGKGMIAEFHTAPRDKGGSGAYVVFLKER